MQKITASESLRLSILVLEQRQAEELKVLGEQLDTTIESFMPLNMMRRVISHTAEEFDVKDHLIRTLGALLSGYIARKVVAGRSRNPVYRLAGMYVQLAVTRFLNHHAQTIENSGRYLITKLLEKFHDIKERDQ